MFMGAAVAINDLTKSYLQEIKRYPLLSKEEEFILAEAASRGDPTAKEKLVNHNLRLVLSIAKEYLDRGLSYSDLVQEGNIGLIKAVNKYDFNRGYRFSTYATYWIRQSISYAVRDSGRNIRIPMNVISLIGKIKKEESSYRQEHGRDPTEEELSLLLKVDIQKIKKAKEWGGDTISLDLKVDDEDDVTIGALIEDKAAAAPFLAIENQEQKNAVDKILNTLNERERIVIKGRFGIDLIYPKTLAELGNELQLSIERVRQIEKTALKKLRNPYRVKMLKKFF